MPRAQGPGTGIGAGDMSIYSRNMTQAATYYPPDGQDGFGDPQFGSGQDVMTRWQAKRDLIRDEQGREIVSDAVVYVDHVCEVGGRIGLGSATVTQAREIRQVGQSPSLLGDETLVKLWL